MQTDFFYKFAPIFIRQQLKHYVKKNKNMANLVSILKDILLFEDNVTIPGFGTFETSYKSAQLDEKTGVIHPPTKSVVFNSAKTEDPDGKLAKAAGRVGVAESELPPLVDEFVKAANAKFDAKASLDIEGVGSLFRNESNQITLNPVSSKLSIDNYGLDAEEVEPVAPADRIVSTTVATPASASTSRGKTTQSGESKTTTKVSTTKVTTTTTTTTKTEEKKSNGLLKALLIILPIVAVLAVLFVIFKDKILGGAGKAKPAVEQEAAPQDTTDGNEPVPDITQNQQSAVEDPEAILAGVGFADVSPQNLGAKYKKYYLVGGSFKDKQKASQELARLGASDILHVDGTDLYRVVFVGSDSAQDIVDAYHAAVSRGINPKNIWLLKNSKNN